MPTHFVGRETLIADVASRLIGGSTLALSADGLPGVGKTTLAVALAYRKEVLDHFTDGVLWGALGLQPNVTEVLGTWAAALGVSQTEIQAANEHERSALLRSKIGQRRFMLIIDDAWPPVESALSLRCGGPNCAHFLTTRSQSVARAFADPGGAVEINELAPEDALGLLRMLAPEASSADPKAAERLVAAVGYLPLSIELLGAYLSSAENRYFREQQEAALTRMADPRERLRQACRRLGQTDGKKLALREIIRLSLDDLPETAVEAFHALGAFAPKPEAFEVQAALVVTNSSPAVLSRLADRHLLEVRGAKLIIHQAVSDLAREDLREAARRRHLSYYVQRARQAGSDWRVFDEGFAQLQWAYLNTQETSEILAAHLVARDYLNLRGLSTSELLWNERALAAARQLGTTPLVRELLIDRGVLYNRLDRYDDALELYSEALALIRQDPQREREGHVLNNVGSVYEKMGELDKALELHKAALKLAGSLQDPALEASCRINMGNIYMRLNDVDAALHEFEIALPFSQRKKDAKGEALVLNHLGILHLRRGNFTEGLTYTEASLKLRRAIGNRYGEGVSLQNLGYAYSIMGDDERALQMFEQALQIHKEVHNAYGQALTQLNIGVLHARHHRYCAAKRELKCVVEAMGNGIRRSELEAARDLLRDAIEKCPD